MGDFMDDDEKRGALLDAIINPIAHAGGDPDAPPPPAEGMGGNRMQGTFRMPGTGGGSGPGYGSGPPAAPASPPTAPSPPGTASSKPADSAWGRYYAQQGLAGELRNTQELEGIPPESVYTRPQRDQLTRDQAAAPKPDDPSHPEYRPGIGARIFRGIKGVAEGIAGGGVIGGLVGGLNTDYGAPTKAYQTAAGKNQAAVANDQRQVSEAEQNYKDAIARTTGAKAAYKDVTTGGTTQEERDNTAARDAETATRDAETARHQREDERLRGNQQAQTASNEAANLVQRTREVNISASRLAWEKAKENTKGAAGNDEIRDGLIDQAAADFDKFKAGVTYNPHMDHSIGGQPPMPYRDNKTGKAMTQEQYIAQLNKIGADLDEKLAAKKKAPLGLRYTGGPGGKEIPAQTGPGTGQPASPAATPPAQGQTPQQPPAAPQQSSDKHEIPPSAAKSLKKGVITTFHGGERWKLGDDGKPEYVGKKK